MENSYVLIRLWNKKVRMAQVFAVKIRVNEGGNCEGN